MFGPPLHSLPTPLAAVSHVGDNDDDDDGARLEPAGDLLVPRRAPISMVRARGRRRAAPRVRRPPPNSGRPAASSLRAVCGLKSTATPCFCFFCCCLFSSCNWKRIIGCPDALNWRRRLLGAALELEDDFWWRPLGSRSCLFALASLNLNANVNVNVNVKLASVVVVVGAAPGTPGRRCLKSAHLHAISWREKFIWPKEMILGAQSAGARASQVCKSANELCK